MNSSYADRRLHTLQIARECASFGARRRTISIITGLSASQLSEWFYPDSESAPRGRSPDTRDWYHTTTLFNRVEASVFTSIYRRIRDLRFNPTESLVSGYRHYRKSHRPTLIDFDRAFDLAAHLDGLWHIREKSFSIITCPQCESHHLTSFSLHPIHKDCPFCKLIQRYPNDRRLRHVLQNKSLSEGVQKELMAMLWSWHTSK